MLKKLFNAILGILLAVTSIIPMNIISTFAAEVKDYIVVDDNVTDNKLDNYFTYIGGSDTNGQNGWSNTADSKVSSNSLEELKTQHWTWCEDTSKAKNFTYTFTFKGTGIDLIGIVPAGHIKNIIQLDMNESEVATIPGNGSNREHTIYSIRNLTPGQHVVKVSLPETESAHGLQISYAKVYGYDQSKNEEALEIPVTKTEGSNNKFEFIGSWNGNNEHRWSGAANADVVPAYKVNFVGHKIDIYAGGNNPHGKVEYFIDDISQGVFDLSRPSNVNSRYITSFNVAEGPHTFKAVAKGERGTHTNNNNPSLCIDAAKVIVYHNPYKVTNIELESDSIKLIEGSSSKISIRSIEPDYASVKDLTFSSSDDSKVTINNEGILTAVSEGSAVITISSKNGNYTKNVNVTIDAAQPNIGGSIVDTDTQYTQKRYEEIKNKDVKSAETLTLWKNDKAVSEIALISKDCKLKNVKITASDLVNVADKNITISNKNVKATFIKSTKAYNGDFLGYGDNNKRPVPTPTKENRSESSDILYQTDPIDMPFNSVQPVWVEINAPKGVAAGTYTTTLTVTATGIETPLTFTYTVNVQNAELKDASEFKNSFDIELWQYPYASAEYYGVKAFSDKHFDILKSQMDLYKSVGGHAITTTIIEDAWGGQTYSKKDIRYPSMIKWEKKNGKMTYDYTDFDKWVKFNKDNKIGDKIVLYSIAPWHSSFTYWENGELVKKGFKAGSQEYKEMWTDFLKNLIDHLMDKGWFDDAYIGIDERGFSKAAFDLIDSVRNIHDKPLKTAGAMDHYKDKYDLALRVTDLNVGDGAASEHPADFDRLLRDRDAKGYGTTLYSCTEHVPGNFSLSNPVESYWSIINAGKKTEGFLRWAYDAWVADPLNDATHNSFEPGDCFLVYPGDKEDLKNGKTPTVRSSVRLEKMAEGVRDVNKLRMIAENAPSLKGKVDAIFAEITFTPITSRRTPNRKYGYLDQNEMNAVLQDTTKFKKAVENITNEYIEFIATASKTVDKVVINEDANLSMIVGESKALNASVEPSNVIDNRLTWESSKPKVISVDEKGKVTANKVGSAVITATSKLDSTKKATIKITSDVKKVDEAARVSYYSFDDKTAKDQWGSRDGVVNSSKASYAEGKSGQALHVTTASKDGAVELSGDIKLPNSKNWTVSYWVKPDSLNGRSVPMADNTGEHGFALRLGTGNDAGLRVGASEGMKLTYKNCKFDTNQWYNVALVQNEKLGTILYVNGKMADKSSWTIEAGHMFKAPLDIIGGEGFTGYIDEVKIYNRVLTDAEINGDMLTNGLNISELEKDLFIGEKYEIDTNLISTDSDKTINFKSLNPSIASVDKEGLVTANARGTAKIEVSAKGVKTEIVTINVRKELRISNGLITDGKHYELNSKYLSDIERSPYDGKGENRQYLGQPDMIRTKTGRLITAYPVGHGKGRVVMKYSEDEGKTWIEKSIETLPKSWQHSQETPTLYKLDMGNGKERLMLITACPGWGDGSTGWNTSISDDNGDTWTEYKHWYTNHANGTPNKSIVGMASLVQLKDEKGNFIQKWMGVYHDYGYVNYKTYLTFDENGKEQWSEPEPYLSQYRDIESRYQMCEIGMFRSPEGNRIIGLARSQSHNNPATLIYSDDEGKTWSKPMDLPGSLAGERHKAVYDPISGRLVITFREIQYDLDGNNQFNGQPDWHCGNWMAWVGTYEDLMNQEEGDYCITLAKDYTQNAKGGDTGYTGVVVLDDGTFVMDTYGHWDEDFSKKHGFGNVTTDLCYIKQAKFKLSDIENENGLVNYDELNAYVQKVENTAADKYTKDSFAKFTKALKNAQNIVANKASQQVEVNNALNALKEAFESLQLKGEVNPTPDSEGNKPVNPDGEKPTPEKPNVPTKPGTEGNSENDVLESEETPNTGISINTALLWTMVLGAGFATVALANKKRKAER